VTKVITFCPHGYNTFRNEYPQLLPLLSAFAAGDRERLSRIEVVPHVLWIHDQLRRGKLALRPGAAGRVAYHDPCYLGRHNGIIKEPREVLSRLGAGAPAELENNREHSFCCGAGGGMMWTEETLGRRINHLRTEEIIRSGAAEAATSCPFCLSMLKDGLKDKERPDIQVRDIAQLVADSIQ